MRKTLSKLALAAAALVGVATSAQAYIILEIAEIGGPGLLCNGQTGLPCVGGFTIINDDLITFAGAVGDFDITFSSNTSNSPGATGIATIDMAGLQVKRTRAAGSGQLFIGVKAFNFTDPSSLGKTLKGSGSHTTQAIIGAGNTATYNFWADGTNAGLATNNISCSYVLNTAAGCDAGLINWVDANGGLFSMRAEALFKLNTGTSVNPTGALIAQTPEPMTLSLVGLALLGAGYASRRAAKNA